jgi:putative endonuclease
MRDYYVYLLTNRSGTLYTGVTSDIQRRLYEHKNKLVEGFTKKYNIDMLVYYEVTDDVNEALTREKQIKAWRRSKRVALIESPVEGSERWLVQPGPTRFLASLGITDMGAPMQTKRMSNGGPTMRSRARLTGV